MGILQRTMCRAMASSVRKTLSVASTEKLMSHYDRCIEIHRDTNDDKVKIMVTMLQIDVAQELQRRGVMTDIARAMNARRADGG